MIVVNATENVSLFSVMFEVRGGHNVTITGSDAPEDLSGAFAVSPGVCY